MWQDDIKIDSFWFFISAFGRKPSPYKVGFFDETV